MTFHLTVSHSSYIFTQPTDSEMDVQILQQVLQSVKCPNILGKYILVLPSTLSTLGKIFSRQHLEIFFFIFPRKQDMTFHANCLLRNPAFWEK